MLLQIKCCNLTGFSTCLVLEVVFLAHFFKVFRLALLYVYCKFRLLALDFYEVIVSPPLTNYLTISRQRRGDYKPIFTEPKAK